MSDNDEIHVLQFSSAQRWQMVQEGYNPLDEESVKRWFNKQPPDRDLAKGVAKVAKQNLGSGYQNDDKDYAALGGEHYDDRPRRNSREDLLDTVNSRYRSHGGREKDIEDKVRSKLNLREQSPRNGTGYQTINQPRMLEERRTRNRELITEAKEAVNIGYSNGIGYLNAFIANLKSPSSESRRNLIEKINALVVDEDKIVEEHIKYYRGGVAKAEKELYAKLTK